MCRGTYFTHKVAENKVATSFVLVVGVVAFAMMFAVNSSVHSYLIVSYSNKVRKGATGYAINPIHPFCCCSRVSSVLPPVFH